MAGPFCRCAHALSVHYAGRVCGLCRCKGFSAEPTTGGYFEVYAQAHGRSSDEQLAHDAERFPGGKMAGFICWMSLRRAEFSVRYPECVRSDGALLDYEKWGRFLWGEGQKASVAVGEGA